MKSLVTSKAKLTGLCLPTASTMPSSSYCKRAAGSASAPGCAGSSAAPAARAGDNPAFLHTDKDQVLSGEMRTRTLSQPAGAPRAWILAPAAPWCHLPGAQESASSSLSPGAHRLQLQLLSPAHPGHPSTFSWLSGGLGRSPQNSPV